VVDQTYQKPQTIPGVRTFKLSLDEVKAAITQWLGPRAKGFPAGLTVVSFTVDQNGASIRAEERDAGSDGG